MPYTDDHKRTMQGINELTPAFHEFRHDLMNKLAVAKTSVYMMEMPETTPAQLQKYIALSLQAMDHIENMFKEMDK